ncbi:C-type lectin lectoxin-Lio3-like [Haliotis asinina]|uniref:C-type lectin lectoxin-Lio3-like n=1 Tax=Haliotis asinina TaxID=109174 RepID=UPI003531A79B
MTAFALMLLVFCHCSLFNENHGRGLTTSNKTQIACAQLRASRCSRTVGLVLRCAPVGLRVTTESKVKRPGYRSLKAGKVKINVKRHVIPLSWDAALSVCQSEGGSLVKIDTKEKETAIMKKFNIQSRSFSPVYLWMGLRYFKVQRKFLWTDKTPLEHGNWGIGEPSHTWMKLDGTVVMEDCVALAVPLLGNIYWNDHPCSKTRGFICEIL